MRSSASFKDQDASRFARGISADLREIDNPDPLATARMNYLDRILAAVDAVKRAFPDPRGVQVAELGSAQANMSLLLAEAGYSVLAVDLDQGFLDYAKAKHERGDLAFERCDLQGLQGRRFDAVILAEVIEHCAYPEDVSAKAMALVKPGGLLVVTTPNGSRLKQDLPTFSRFASREARKELEARQFGPDGEDHLFLFTLEEMDAVLPAGKRLSLGYCGGSLMINSKSRHLLRLLPRSWAPKAVRLAAAVPGLRRLASHNLIAVIQAP